MKSCRALSISQRAKHIHIFDQLDRGLIYESDDKSFRILDTYSIKDSINHTLSLHDRIIPPGANGIMMRGMMHKVKPLSKTNKLELPILDQIDMEEEDMIQTTELERILKGNQGLRGMANNIENKIIVYQSKKIKAKFGIEMKITDGAEIRIITEWIKRYDKNFEHHIANPYILRNTKFNEPVLDSCFIIKITEATYVYIDATSEYNWGKRDNDNGIIYNPIYMYIFGRKMYAVFLKLSKYIKNKIKSDNMIYSIAGNNDNSRSCWTCTASSLIARDIDTIFIDKNKKQAIIDHLNEWSANESVYTDRGLLFKTGILLHGHPGTGKTSMAIAIANYLGCSLITIDSATFQHISISEIVDSITADETRYVILIDEIDTIFKSRDDNDITETQQEKTSKLLQLLDSQQSPTNVVFIGTTNYYDRLDPAVLRDGRFNLKVEMGNIDKQISRDMCRSFNLSEPDIDKIINSIKEDTINPCELQNKILSYIKDHDIDIKD